MYIYTEVVEDERQRVRESAGAMNEYIPNVTVYRTQ